MCGVVWGGEVGQLKVGCKAGMEGIDRGDHTEVRVSATHLAGDESDETLFEEVEANILRRRQFDTLWGGLAEEADDGGEGVEGPLRERGVGGWRGGE